jgi:DNA-binding transcriptional ArsR family regulator
MSSIFPIREKVSLDREPEPRLVDLDEETADEVFEALASTTTRKIFLELHNQPQTASDLADVTDTSVQNVQYHLEKLTEADLVDVVDTWYSERGSEMKVYAPTDDSLVLFAGRDKQSAFRRLVNRFAGVLAFLLPPSILAGYLANWRESSSQEAVPTEFGDESSGDAGAPVEETPQEQPEPQTAAVEEESDEMADATPQEDSDAADSGGGDGSGGGSDSSGGDDGGATGDSGGADGGTGEEELTGTVDESFHARMNDSDIETIQVDVDNSTQVADALASNNETVYLVTEKTSNEILGIDPTVALAFFLGGLVVYGMFAFRRRY